MEQVFGYIKLNELHAFKNHPFEVRDDEEMRAMVSSVKDKGVTQPAIVRPREDGGYEIVSCPGRIIRRLPFLISLLGNFQKIISSEYSFHSTTLENCPPNNPILVNLPYFCS